MLPRVVLGRTVITPGALQAIAPEDVRSALFRHSYGDWGEICPEDRLENDRALEEGERILSAYHSRAGEKFWIITEWDRSVTTVLLPNEY